MTPQSFQSAMQLHQAGQLDQAEAVYRQTLAREPENFNALHLLGVLYAQRGQLDQAETLIRQAIALRPNVPEFYGNLAEAMISANRRGDAIACLRKLIALQPANHAALLKLGRLLAEDGQLGPAIDSIKSAVQLDPKNPAYRGHLAAAYTRAKRPDLAAVELREGTRLAPGDIRFWINLGTALSESGQCEQGLEALDQALKINPNLAGAHCNKAVAFWQLNRHQEAMAAIRRAVEIDPACPGAQNNFGAMLCHAGKLEETLQAWRLAVAHDPNSPGTHWNLARILLRLGHFAEGWEEFEWRLKFTPMRLARNFSQPQWNGENPSGKIILLHAEGGFGDAIQFIRLVPQITARGGRWILECQPGLVKLLQATPGIERIIPRGDPLPQFDLQIPLQGLPRICKIQLDNIPNKVPYLAPPTDRVQYWSNRLAGEKKFRVGLVWAGSAGGVGDNRSRSIQIFSPLAGIEGVKFYSLQKGAESAEPPPPGMDWADFTPELTDFSETAALVMNLDLVITVDTSMAHLAGALAKPVWVMIPFLCDFRWLADRTDSPWYPTMRLFREPAPGDQATPAAQIADALKTIADGRN